MVTALICMIALICFVCMCFCVIAVFRLKDPDAQIAIVGWGLFFFAMNIICGFCVVSANKG
jgi:hypothetical protein